jgi:ABC-type Fe3+/spermidine/putrescine transport system ATPase subunit
LSVAAAAGNDGLTTGGDNVLELRGVSKEFGAVQAVRDLSLEVRRGELLSVLGPSGCGKTTTLRMIVGLERVSAGEIQYGGQIVDAAGERQFVPPHQRNMGMVFQSYAIWPHMTVGENVGYPLKVRRTPQAETRDRVARALEQVDMAGYEQRPATMLSGGQQQRVAVARSLVMEPDILLLDEPFSNVDAKLRDQMRTELRVLQRRLGITVLFVTHDQVEALSISDRIAVMSNGTLEQVGTPIDLYRHPATTVVRDFVGRMITIECVVDGATGGSGQALPLRLNDADGPLVQAVSADASALAAGSTCVLAVRPEAIAIEPRDGAADARGPDTFYGIIAALLFVGDRFEARIEMPWGQEVMVYVPAEDRWREGQTVSLRMDPHSIQVWPA